MASSAQALSAAVPDTPAQADLACRLCVALLKPSMLSTSLDTTDEQMQVHPRPLILTGLFGTHKF